MLIEFLAIGAVICIALVALIGAIACSTRPRPGKPPARTRGTPTEIDEEQREIGVVE